MSEKHSIPFEVAQDQHGDTVTRSRLSPQQRIPQILQAAAQEFARRGFQQTRVQDIATAAGLSKGGFYAHFSGKEAVFDQLLKCYLSSSAINLQDEFRELPPHASAD